MTGFNSEADELQFQLELGETPPPASNVATSNIHELSRHNDPESLRPTESHVLGVTRGSSREPRPRSPSTLHIIWDHLDKIQPNPKVMAAQAMEALNRTFIELKSKNEETRLRASYDLRDLVVSAARGKAFCSPRLICMS